MLAESQTGGVPVAPASSSRLYPAWKEIVAPVNPFIEQVAVQLAKQVDVFDREIAPYARYALTNQGKQLRPVLVALSAGSVGRVTEALVTVAVIIEMVHLATLVHDDVMDEAEMRRRRPTMAANWGNEVSVLVGDCLFAHALRMAASFPTPEICRAVASATNTVCSGEILQTHQRRNFDFTKAQYFRILEMKTAELFALSCDLGAALSGGSGAGRAALRKFGLALGTAYQVYDDCLDLFGSETVVGKSLGTDLANGKLTLPILIVLERATHADRTRLKACVTAWQPNHLSEILELIEKYDAHSASKETVHEYLDAARQCLASIPESSSKAALLALTDFLAQQTDMIGVSS